MRKSTAAALLMLPLAACYHATIETGLQPGTETISQPWALSFVYGLVPPPTVQTAQKCRGGVAKVETQQSFLNGLVSALTFGIFTPMDIKVTCAAARAADDRTIRSNGDAVASIAKAADLAVERATPVFVQF